MTFKLLGWFNWKNPDEAKSRPLSEANAELSMTVIMGYEEYAQLMKEFGRKEFYITFEPGEGSFVAQVEKLRERLFKDKKEAKE